MRRLLSLAIVCAVGVPAAHAATITFTTNPLTGNVALTTPGRQIVANEPSITFNPATDVFAFDAAAFGVTAPLSFANGLTTAIPTTHSDVIVVRNGAPLAAGTAADAIAARVTESGGGFFIYFNSTLNLPRLVYSTNLDDATADLAILARMTNLSGPEGFATLAAFSSANFQTTAVPEPTMMTLWAASAFALVARARARRR